VPLTSGGKGHLVRALSASALPEEIVYSLPKNANTFQALKYHIEDATRSGSVLVGFHAADHFEELLETLGSDEISDIRGLRDLEQITHWKIRDPRAEIGVRMHLKHHLPEGVAVALDLTKAGRVAGTTMLQALLQIDKGPLKPPLSLSSQVGFSSAELM